jgi:predicted aldo/keto reductase-like oxidoreductase|tara:strand:- start:993 stop:1223 length:231 start_codon:yes stop_codon:yes gene_type:complete
MRKVNKQQAFQMLIEERMQVGITYVDAMVEYMVEHQLEPKHVAKLISPAFLEKVTKEAVANNVIKDDEEKGSVLPL